MPGEKFFTVGVRNGHWWLITPKNETFFSIGMNHIDSSALRYADNIRLWRKKYQNDQKKWIQKSLVPDLKAWGFNTIGWTQESVVRGPTLHRHSRGFTYEEYRWTKLPYCHLLPFVEFHQWELETCYPDFFSQEFEDWCDFVARDNCSRMADDPLCIGYFYSDCPTWVHARQPEMKGPLLDPELLETKAGRNRLFELATRYYRVTHDAIRRYDPNHLILGDRYEGKEFLPDEILKAALPYVDVLSFQYFSGPDEICSDFQKWHVLTGLPILLADACVPRRDGDLYPFMLQALWEHPCCIGWHYCGAYLKNRCRGVGFRDEQENTNKNLIKTISRANAKILEFTQGIKESNGLKSQ